MTSLGKTRLAIRQRCCFSCPAIVDRQYLPGFGVASTTKARVVFVVAVANTGDVPMKTQSGKQMQINLSTVMQNGQGVVVAAGYRVVSPQGRPTPEHLSPDCCRSGHAVRANYAVSSERLEQSLEALRQFGMHEARPAMILPGAATAAALTACDSHLPAPAWAAFVLNHALCG